MFHHKKFKSWIGSKLPGKRKEEKITKRQKELISQFDKGRILQIDNGKDNKEYFESIKE